MIFSDLSKLTLTKAVLFKDSPVYVQFYLTARCNLTCNQCNIIYSNSDLEECSIDSIKKIADNFADMGVAIVLLTGGEPFLRKDINEIIYAFESRGIHVRMQTNGLANEEQISSAIEAGGRDISISLDSLNSADQDFINGGFPDSWFKAIKAISLFTKYLPKDKSFASLGCVLQPKNLHNIIDVIRFGTAISWYTSLVPIHVTKRSIPRGFRTHDQSIGFKEKQFQLASNLIDQVSKMKEDGYLLYDSDQYLDDIKKFIRGEPTSWRDNNKGVCDSPNLYFAVLPNGDYAPCCDHRFNSKIKVYDPDFPKIYKSKTFRKNNYNIVKSCEGCMYGSYPEMTIAMRFFMAKIQRLKIFFSKPTDKSKWPIDSEEIKLIIEEINLNKYSYAKKNY